MKWLICRPNNKIINLKTYFKIKKFDKNAKIVKTQYIADKIVFEGNWKNSECCKSIYNYAIRNSISHYEL